MNNLEVHALVLAAGASRRFGRDKLTATLGATTVLGSVLAVAAQCCRDHTLGGTLVVCRSPDSAAAALAREMQFPVVCPEVEHPALSRSLQTGITALNRPGIGAALILPGDQPQVKAEVIRALVESWRSSRVPAVRPRYVQTPDIPGHPVLVDRVLWNQVDTLSGDQGLAAVFEAEPGRVRIISAEGANPDIDTEKDLAHREATS